MRFGITVPNFGDYFDARLLAALARDAEAAGWDGFFLWDHVLYGPVPVVDPWIALTAIALNTERIRLGTMVTPLPRRHIYKLARETVSLDHLSKGRLIFGVGIGAGAWEWEYLGLPSDLKVRGEMLDEGLELLTKLWSGEPFRHEGKYYTVRGDVGGEVGNAQFLPATFQKPRIPIWVGGALPNKAPFRRAARWDGVVPLSNDKLTPDSLRDMVNYVQQHRSTLDAFDIVVAGATGENPTKERELLAQYLDAGATWWLEGIDPWRFGWNWQGAWDLAAMNERVRKGPPRF
jgi:alkanesulfonate monooxygenase SsuD/methylene tetrahydromethanopterin reductase-like flavin-dependent oxidoreductase (luciferase family)